MSRATKRRAEREGTDDTLKSVDQTGKPTEINLVNPATEHFQAFIFGNATKCERVVDMGSAVGKTLAICGAGPSLAAHVDRLAEADDVWGVNSAAIWLHDNGHPLTHAFSIDQTPVMLKEWLSAPDVEYLLASTVHVHLVDYLIGKGRSLRFFHNYVGIKAPPVSWDDEKGEPRTESYEDWLYLLLYPGTIRAGNGLNGATRAVDVARYMGYEKIMLLGADCATEATGPIPDDIEPGTPAFIKWLEDNTTFHVDGGSAVTNGQTAMMLQGWIDDRHWMTKPDLMISAVAIAKWIQAGEFALEVIGDTLPNALKDKDQAFFDRLPALGRSDGERIEV